MKGKQGGQDACRISLVFAVFFFILTLLFERFIAWLEGKSEQTKPIVAKLASTHTVNTNSAGNAGSCQGTTHLWQRILLRLHRRAEIRFQRHGHHGSMLVPLLRVALPRRNLV